MADYVVALKKDLVEQFRGKAKIEALLEVIGAQFQQVYDFYDQLRYNRDVYTAVGKNLDGVGDIAVLTRMEAAQIAGGPIPAEVIDDEIYRQYLIYKILKNTCGCTYPDIIKAFKMFWDKPIYYSEDPQFPATIILDTGILEESESISKLLGTPIIRAGGVAVRYKTRKKNGEIKIYTGFAVRVGRIVSVGCEIPAALDVTYITDEAGNLLADETGNRIIDEEV